VVKENEMNINYVIVGVDQENNVITQVDLRSIKKVNGTTGNDIYQLSTDQVKKDVEEIIKLINNGAIIFTAISKNNFLKFGAKVIKDGDKHIKTDPDNNKENNLDNMISTKESKKFARGTAVL
jgi:hypothetical protein